MSKIIDFYRGPGTDHAGRTLADYRLFGGGALEQTHDYIQWMFPNMEASRFNPNAPLLTQNDIDEFLTDEALMIKVRESFAQMCVFYFTGLYKDEWITPRNHNFLRITRMLKFGRSLELNTEMDHILLELLKHYTQHPTIIGKETLRFWLDASEYLA